MSIEACADFWRWCATVPVIGFTFAVAGLGGCGVIGRPQAGTTSNSDTLFSTVAGEDYGYEIVAAKSDDSAGEWTFALKSQRPPKDNNLRFEWEIDGQAYQGLAVSHIFSETGTFVISVRAIEPNGNDVFVLTLEIQIELPPPPNQAPVAVALAVSKDGRVVVRDGGEGEQVLGVYENEQVFLDGSESYDPDGDDTSFEWAQVTGNAIHLVQLVDASAAVASFVTPTVDGDARLAFTLIVSDGQRNTEVIVPVDVLNIVEIVGADPEADAGEPQEVTEGDLVTLDGSNSKGSGTGELRFHWAQTCGPLVALVNASQAMAAFNAPTIELESETLCFELTVSQDDLAAADEVRITILPAEPPGGEPPPDTPPCDDEDGDAICRDMDNCPSHSNSDQADDDLDGLGNVCDGCPNDPANDVDDDGRCGDVDNCPLAGNASQADSDGDGIGDACDDSDGDGVLDMEDNCPAVANADQADSDGDGVGDACESEPSECKTGSSDWQNALVEQQTGAFEVQFDATPGATPIDAIIALSSGEGSAFSHYAVLVRFNSAGTIDARNGGSYASDSTIRYTAGTNYRLRLVVDVPLKTYSVFVTPPESDEIGIAADYAFRSEQNEVGSLDNWGVWAGTGSHQVCTFSVGDCLADTDGDGATDCEDGCPGDVTKTAPGLCGCGTPETDSDTDGVPDCNDQCPGAPDDDSDNDGLANCIDGCSDDPGKSEPGQCGCGVADVDSDGDGTADCLEPPKVCVTPSSLYFTASPSSATFQVWNCGSDSLSYEISGDADWLTVSPGGGSSTGERDTITASVEPGLDDGTYQAEITVTPDRALSVVISVALNVGPAQSGWTEFTPSADTLIVYVSSSEGNDSNDGSLQSPVRTLGNGRSLLRDGYPDWMLLKRGDVWYESFGVWRLSGRSVTEPMLISSYGDSAARPILRTGSSHGISFMGDTTSPRPSNLAIVGLRFEAHTYNGSGTPTGIYGLRGGENYLIEDCRIDGYSHGLIIKGHDSEYRNINIRRTVVVDSFSTDTHSQGMYANGVHGLLIEECIFDHNGWNPSVAGAEPTMYSHNFYIYVGCSDVTFRRNIIARASSHGISLNPSGLIEDNLFVQNAVNVFMRTAPAVARGNVVLEGKDISDDLKRGFGIIVGDSWTNPSPGPAVVERNVVAHKVALGSHPAISIEGDVPAEMTLIRDNIVFDWGEGTLDGSFIDPERSVASYHVSVEGEGSLEAFIAEARRQSKTYWRPEYTAEAVNEYIRDGFQPLE